jgi:isopenicillin N synthase-like dioxygenase
MNHSGAKALPESAIPVIDIACLANDSLPAYRSVAAGFLRAARTVGFFYVANHGVPAELIDDTFAVAREFFAAPEAQKLRVRVSERHRGYLGVGEARMQGSRKVDLKESFIWGREFTVDEWPELAANPMLGPNRWPDFVPRMPAVLNAYFEACVALGLRLLKVFAVALEIDPGYFTSAFARTVTRGSVLYYAPQPPELGADQFGVAPHTDYGCLTLVVQDATGGLQVRAKDGSWVTAAPIDGTYVVNVGDLLARWTNNLFRSTAHRVINSTGRARQSVAVFVDPDFETRIVPVVRPGEPAKFPETTCGEYILGRFDKSFDYRQPRS